MRGGMIADLVVYSSQNPAATRRATPTTSSEIVAAEPPGLHFRSENVIDKHCAPFEPLTAVLAFVEAEQEAYDPCYEQRDSEEVKLAHVFAGGFSMVGIEIEEEK